MPTTPAEKLAILRDNPHVIAVSDRLTDDGPPLILYVTHNQEFAKLRLPVGFAADEVDLRVTLPFRDLRLDVKYADELCYNEPVPGGVQIQPQGAGWVGTLGTACKFDSRSGHVRFGILSNWHVMCPTPSAEGHPIHQPRDSKPAIAHLEDWEPVSPSAPNYFDAAVADAKIDGLHTITPEIRCLGEISQDMVAPSVNLHVAKCGRTTGLTFADCETIHTGVKVSYGDFTATFLDQAIFKSPGVPFSLPGDSGSLIVEAQDRHPCALLFAGNSELTIGSPLVRICNRFNLSFQFPEL